MKSKQCNVLNLTLSVEVMKNHNVEAKMSKLKVGKVNRQRVGDK